MILTDSSIWIDHFRMANLTFARLVTDGEVLIHPFVLGELALGSLKGRQKTIADLADLGSVKVASPEDVLYLIERHGLFSRGIGYVDTHLLAAAVLHGSTRVLTRDRRLREAAEQLGIAA